MPICTVERNLPGSAAIPSAIFTEPVSLPAAIFSRAGRAETIASSDMASSPFSRIRLMMMTRSVQGKGATIVSR